ncbi:5127_t:CDS:2 [Scutellospora calospora]|uniref:5127_t:CDS:1 n=1 Tax=Scutellospora calospora TaxID=85575 RepID=A0ACA9M580_9GLOM|nr:5127_t:CDS:2 [Scutellospora calospora]
MKANTKLQTTLSHNLFNFLKSYLHDFFPKKETKPATQNQKASKATFKQLIRIIAGAHPKFLTDFVFQSNPNIDPNTTIPFNIFENILKKLIHKFTTILFTKLNFMEEQSTLQQIIKYFKETALPEAKQYLFNKFNVSFTETSLLEDSLFF